MPEIYLYAELLVHIRQLTLHASLQNPRNEHTTIDASSDKTLITVVHDGESASLYLPTQISGTAGITFPLDRRTEIAARLQIEDLAQLEGVLQNSTGIEVPWCAANMTSKSTICCKLCQTPLIAPDRIQAWKDLPSENWAELMDFWFCHKPNEEGVDNAHAAEAKGFSSNSKLVATAHTGLVDTVSFLVHADDCTGLEVSPEDKSGRVVDVFCQQCRAITGSANTSDNGFRLYKSRISVRQGPEADHEAFPAATFICAQLLSLIENSVGRRVVVHNNNRTPEGLLCWIFNPDIYYSSSKKDATAHRAMKVFYQTIQEPVKVLDENGNNLEELIVTTEDLSDLGKMLETTTGYLPLSARKFQEWNVGLLDRYEKQPTGQGAMDQNALNRKSGEIKILELPEEMRELYV